MAPKRFAPPPPVESSAETASGSESDDASEEIAYSPPTATSKQTAPPPPQVQQPEDSDDEDEDEDGEDEEEEETEEEEEEEEEEKANHTVSASAAQDPPQPPLEPDESDESDEEEEEGTDDEAPQPVLAPNQEATEGKKPFQRSWSKDDEVRILEAVAAHRRVHGKMPQPEDLETALAGTLDNSDHGLKELAGKLKSLRSKYTKNSLKVDLPSNDLDRRIFDLSKEIWGGGGDQPADGAVRRDFDETCRMYPYLAEEIKGLEKTYPGLFKRSMIDDDKARALNKKIKKQRVHEMKVELRGIDLYKEVTKTLMNLTD